MDAKILDVFVTLGFLVDGFDNTTSVPFYRDVQIIFSDRRAIIHCQQSFLPCFLLLAPDQN